MTREQESQIRAILRKHIDAACDEMAEHGLPEDTWWPAGYAEQLTDQVTHSLARMQEAGEENSEFDEDALKNVYFLYRWKSRLDKHWKARLDEYIQDHPEGRKFPSLCVTDFRFYVSLRLADGSSFFFRDAFYLVDEEMQEVGIFTEHCGYHIFPLPEAEVMLLQAVDGALGPTCE